MTRYIRQTDVMEFLQTADPTSAAGRTTGDAWHQFLVGQTGIDGSIEDLERQWLRSEGASGETLHDLWGNYLSASGYTSGGLKDRFRAFVNSSGVIVTFVYLQEDGVSRYLLEDGSGAYILN